MLVCQLDALSMQMDLPLHPTLLDAHLLPVASVCFLAQESVLFA
ncbi:hypothetical protein NXW10_14765 [Bacteroides fragilis]|nr:hypothetical protein NXW10_14765 [Bacteroides fragilis]